PFLFLPPLPPRSTLFPYTTLFRSRVALKPLATIALVSSTTAAIVLVLWANPAGVWVAAAIFAIGGALLFPALFAYVVGGVSDGEDRKSTRLNSSHRTISYAVFCLK